MIFLVYLIRLIYYKTTATLVIQNISDSSGAIFGKDMKPLLLIKFDN